MGAGAAAAAAAAVAKAVQASGTIVELELEEFKRILYGGRDMVVVMSPPRLFHNRYDYITSYRGLAFCTRSPSPIAMPGSAELIAARKIWLPF